jgi:hypothetical protein
MNNPIINDNIRLYIVPNIADISQEGTQYTITFALSLYNILESATIDAIEDKGWLVAGA